MTMTRPTLRTAAAMTVLTIALLGSSAVNVFAVGGGAQVKVIVDLKAPANRSDRMAITALGGSVRQSFRLINAISATLPKGAISVLEHNPNVRTVEMDHTLTVMDAELDASWGVKHIGAGDVHAAGNVGAGVTIGVIDTGIDCSHPDLVGVCAGGWDFVNNDSDPNDDFGHGTAVAGILAAQMNGFGVVGVAPGAKLYAYKVLGADGTGDYSNLIAALQMASMVDHVDIVNMSLGGPTASQALADAVAAAYAQGTILVAASGNVDPTNLYQVLFGCPVMYPGAYPQVFATTYTDPNDALTGFSCTGPQVDFAAPGDLINVPVPTGNCPLCDPSGYRDDLSGTSFASPHLAGTVALVLAHGISNGGDTSTLADDVKAHLCATTTPGYGVLTTPIDPTDPRYAEYFGCGVVNAANALLVDPPPTGGNNPPVAVDDSATTDQGVAVTVNVLANDSDPDGDPLTVTAVSQPANGSVTFTATDVTYTPAANFYGNDSFGYTISDGNGGSASATVAVTVNHVNQAPVAVGDSATTAQDTPVTVNVLANDSDPDGDTLSVLSVGAPSHGSAGTNGTTVTYTPAAGYSGSDLFAYTIQDTYGATASATVSVTVTPAAGPTMHVGLLADLSVTRSRNWTAKVRIRVLDGNGAPLSGVVVTGTFSTGQTKSCTTGNKGQCALQLGKLSKSLASVTFTVNGLVLAGWTYEPADNTATSIVLKQP
jgi:subtilisin